jgi:SAM-dependent methyltransferase
LTTITDARERLAQEWRGINPATPEAVAGFYRESRTMADDLEAWHRDDPDRQLWTRAVAAAAKVVDAKRVLDVGAGLGHDLLAARELLPGCVLTAVEPNNDLRRHLLDHGVDAYPGMRALPPWKFDLAICIDVLEHVTDPNRLLEQIIGSLRMGGILVEATATHDIGTPLHLPELRGWLPNRLLDRHGFTLRETVGDRLHVWQRVSEARGTEANLLLCAYRSLTVETAQCLTELAKAGWRYNIHRGDALISRVRSIAVSNWLRSDDGDVFLMVDDDIVFTPEDAEKVIGLAREKRGIAGAAYPVRGGTHLACRGASDNILFGPDVQPVEIEYAATGFMAVHRQVCEAIAATMPLCHPAEEWCFWPMFQPMVVENGDQHEYLSEDWAFNRRARDLGYRVWLDPRVMLTHLGVAPYTIETMQGARFEEMVTDGRA